jgi:superfamily II DNA/RNA helicase
LAKKDIVNPFPIQVMAMPDALAGRDVAGKAQTGSGKTLAFGIPALQRIGQAKPRCPLGLIMVPTRELCIQVATELAPIAQSAGKWLGYAYGGASMKKQEDALNAGVDLLVATPGRLIDLEDRGIVSLADVQIVILDEADQMADMGFLPQVRHVLRRITNADQMMLFSATLDGAIGSIVNQFMTDPVFHEVENETETVDTMEHRFIEVHGRDKPLVAGAIADAYDRTIVFTQTKRGADRLYEDLRDQDLKVGVVHGDLPQRVREKALQQFRDGKIKALVATNVAARGLHIDNVDVVIHYDPPSDYKTFVHRSGRTARAGEDGVVVTLLLWNEKIEVRRLARLAEIDVGVEKMFSSDPRLADLAGWEPPPAVITSDKPTWGAPGRRRRR